MICLIIEDEKIAAERLKNMLLQIEPSAEITAVLQSVSKSVEWFNMHSKPDLIFMDIQLADGLCFEIFDHVIITTPIIFTTAYNEYALKAFKLNSIDYLLKPIDLAELDNAVRKYKTTNQAQEYPAQLFDTFLKTMGNRYKSKFVIKVGERLKVFTTDDIQCFVSMEKSVFLQSRQGRDYAINYTLDQLEELLDPARFFRISRKHIVAFQAIKDIVTYSNSRLQIMLETNSGEDFVVSRERVQQFKKWLEE